MATAAVIGFIAGACTGGEQGAEDATTTSVMRSSGSATAPRAETGAPLWEQPMIVSEVVDPDAGDRCERFGYPCSYDEVDLDVFWSTSHLARELDELVNDADDVYEGLGAAMDVLAEREDIAELIVDGFGASGLMFRLEGGAPAMVITRYGSPLGVSELDEPDEPLEGPLAVYDPRQRVEPEVTLDRSDLFGTPVGLLRSAGAGAPGTYRPVGGPLEMKTALVIDGLAADELDSCPSWVDRDRFGCRGEKSNLPLIGFDRTEGVRVASIMAAHPQIEVTYLNEIDPWDLAATMPSFDLVHVVGHGSAACAPGGRAFTATLNVDSAQPLRDVFDDQELDPDLCYSGVQLGRWSDEQVAELERRSQSEGVLPRLPTSFYRSGSGWAAADVFFAAHLRSDAIAFISSCTSADGQLAADGPDERTLVLWHGYARAQGAERAAVTFWDALVTEGLDTETADRLLRRRQLDWTLTPLDELKGVRPLPGQPWILVPDVGYSVMQAQLVVVGANQRARDVITTTYLDTATIGLVGDDVEQVIPEVRFLVEGVLDGQEVETRIRTLLDGAFLEPDRAIHVADGSIIREGEGWNVWEVVVTDLRWPFDLAIDDIRPSAPRSWTWEVRASIDGGPDYTAHRLDDVAFSGELAASATLPTFSELGAQLGAAGGSLEGNQLRLLTRSDGGAVVGRFDATMSVGGTVVGRWELDVAGRYDPLAGTMNGTVEGLAQGGAAGVFSSEEGAGTWSGQLDLGTGELTGMIEIGGQVELFDGLLAGAPGADQPHDHFDDLEPPVADPEGDPGALVG